MKNVSSIQFCYGHGTPSTYAHSYGSISINFEDSRYSSEEYEYGMLADPFYSSVFQIESDAVIVIRITEGN